MFRSAPTTPPEQENNLKDRPPIRASTTFYDRIVTDWWWWELLSWTVSFACVAAIIGVLWYYDGKRQPEYLVTGITLNAYVSVFAAVSKAALILPVSEAIGQLKWVWFQEEAALWDFQSYDAASRGPWGAAMLLIKTRCRHLVSLGALVTVLALAFEPFFQQIVAYPERMTATQQGITWAARSFVPNYTPILRKFCTDTRSDPTMSAVIDAAFNTPEIGIRPSTATCPTGNCTWPSYSTLGVCHECQDVSSSLEYHCKNNTSLDRATGFREASDPCGFKINNTFLVGSTGVVGFRRVTSLTTLIVNTSNTAARFDPFLNSTKFRGATLPIVDFYIGYTPGGPAAVMRNETPVFSECLLTWCVKTLQARVNNGTLEESVVDTITIQPDSYSASSPIVAALGPNETFNIINQTTEILRDWIISDLPPILSQNPEFPFGSDMGIWNFHHVPPYDFEGGLSNLTRAITNNMKSRGVGTVPIEGTAWKSEKIVQIRWVWITLPAILLVGSLVLLCATIWEGRRTQAPVWKSSALATLLHGLSEETQRRIDPDLSSSQIEAISTKLRVRLSSQRGDARLVAT
ncbi:uncharacterized protein ALTATR162_LOCUS11412 [Alternaria atra]|uniref:Uncharacterized protein n=1 Tax=Alternaria atra TaxID=119953 RepID=A0A8J2IBN0_9PLEO|nr:uncharacterized protein ALTATR162_LOCUS11412 [Alternaria atra]CAG5185822.1 unnamed protein product [Alternaria atra]